MTLFIGEALYKNACTFIPERWYESSSMIKEESAYAPFSAGPYGCIGRLLALMNLRTTVAKLLNVYDVCLADGENFKTLEKDKKAHFTTAPGALYPRFTKRHAAA